MKQPISLLDLFIRQTSVKTIVPESIVERIVSHQWQTAKENLGKEQSVEISGFGKFKLRWKKPEKRITDLQEKIEVFKRKIEEAKTETEKNRFKTYIERYTEEIEYLKTKIENE